jgi:hypothetical protein
VASIDEKSLKDVSNKVFNLSVSPDIERIELLCDLRHGIGTAVASTILTFFDPKNYGVFDFHVWQEVLGGRPKHTVMECVKLLSRLRQEAEMYSLDTRTVDCRSTFKSEGSSFYGALTPIDLISQISRDLLGAPAPAEHSGQLTSRLDFQKRREFSINSRLSVGSPGVTVPRL